MAIQPSTGDVTLRRRRWSVEEYERFIDLGILRPDESLELIGGEVLEQVSPQKSTHATAIRAAEEFLRRAFAEGFDVRVQLPLTLGDDSQPEPDVAVVPGSFRDYSRSHPQTAQLVVEVSDATLMEDRNLKAGLYARSGIPEYWIINLQGCLLEVHRDPAPAPDEPFGHQYRTVLRLNENDTVQPLSSTIRVTVRDLLP